MNFSMNKVIIVGNVVKDPDFLQRDGRDIANITIATDHGKGEAKKTEFTDCVGFGAIATTIARHLKKGEKVYIEGRITYDRWKAKESEAMNVKAKVIINSFKFLSTKASKEGNTEEKDAFAPVQQPNMSAPNPFSVEDIPF